MAGTGVGTSVHPDRFQTFFSPFAACASLMLASLANFLVSNDYPLLRLEILFVALGFVALSGVAAVLYVILPRWGQSLLEGLVVALFVELNTASLPLAITAGSAVFGFSLWKRVSLTKPMALFGSVVLVTTLLGLGERTPWIHATKGKYAGSKPAANDTRPAILHLILDEQIGMEGLPESDADAVRLRDQLKSFYVGARFATYGGAYSEHMRTKNAIPHVLNYGARLGPGMDGRTAVIGPTTHLETLVDKGYRLHILQSDYADFCTGARFHECVTYEVSSPTALLRSPLTTLERAGLITTKLLSLSEIVTVMMAPWRFAADQFGLPKLGPANLGRSTSAATLTVFDELSNKLSRAKPGEVYFAHLLLPHYPYAVDDNCRLLRWRDWKRPFSGKSLSVRQRAYYAQNRCTLRKIDAALGALDRSPAAGNAVVIIHGDHGSRISHFDPTPENLGKLSDDDLIAEYSTMFAVRAPKIAPSYSGKRLPVHSLLKGFAASEFKKAPNPVPPSSITVHLDGPDGAPAQRVPLPASWAPDQGTSRGLPSHRANTGV